jgi:hypothetical protein
MAKQVMQGGSNRKKPLALGAPGTKMMKQEVPFGGVAKLAIKGAAKVVEKVVAKNTAKSTVKALKKVNTPAKSAAGTEAKANARALKAANKPVKSKDADIMNRNNPYARQAVLNEKPANPKVVRGGSMKSKINWPDSMTKGK